MIEQPNGYLVPASSARCRRRRNKPAIRPVDAPRPPCRGAFLPAAPAVPCRAGLPAVPGGFQAGHMPLSGAQVFQGPPSCASSGSGFPCCADRPAASGYEGDERPAWPARAAQSDRIRCTDDGATCISVGNYVADVCSAIERAAGRNRLDPHFFARLLWKESLFEPGAISPVGAQGIAQFMPGTAQLVGLDDPFNPAKAIGGLGPLSARNSATGSAMSGWPPSPITAARTVRALHGTGGNLPWRRRITSPSHHRGMPGRLARQPARRWISGWTRSGPSMPPASIWPVRASCASSRPGPSPGPGASSSPPIPASRA